jgi:hypothetical protein
VQADGTRERTLRHECGVFARYLLGRDADDYLLGKYVALQHRAIDEPHPPTRIDAALLRVARLGIAGTRMADAYARIFNPEAVLRRKLILVLALAENSRTFHSWLTSGAAESRLTSAARVGAAVAGFVLALTVGVLVFTPLRLLPDAARKQHGA